MRHLAKYCRKLERKQNAKQKPLAKQRNLCDICMAWRRIQMWKLNCIDSVAFEYCMWNVFVNRIFFSFETVARLIKLCFLCRQSRNYLERTKWVFAHNTNDVRKWFYASILNQDKTTYNIYLVDTLKLLLINCPLKIFKWFENHVRCFWTTLCILFPLFIFVLILAEYFTKKINSFWSIFLNKSIKHL